MVKKIEHFMLPEHHNRLYTEEAISSVALVRDVAEKINEIVDAYNELNEWQLAKHQEQDGTIRKGVLFMKDNLLNSLNDLMNVLLESGYVDDRVQTHIGALTERVDLLVSTIGDSVNDAEVIDGRVSYRGVVYDNIGNSIRFQFSDVLNMCKEILKLISLKSEVNFIHLANLVMETDNRGFTASLDTETQTITLDGLTTEQNSFVVYCDGSMIDNTKGDPYLMFENVLENQSGATWGVKISYTDGTDETLYTNSSIFHAVQNGKTIKTIRVILGTGFVFDNTVLKLYGTYYKNGSHLPYENYYQLKNEAELQSNKLKNKKWVSLGDSLTQNTGNTGETWQKQVSDVFGLNPVICGAGGRTTSGLLLEDVYSLIPADTDIITVMAGTNDFAQNLQLYVEGTNAYYNTGHYAGAIRGVVKKLQMDFPNAKIIFCTCLGARLDSVGVNQAHPSTNGKGLTTYDYARTCKEVCASLGVPCIDLHGESGLNFLNSADYLTDQVHPNKKGYERIASVYIQNFKKLFL